MIFGDDGKLDAVNSLTCNACELFGLVDKLCPVYKIRKVALNVDMDVALSALDHMKLAMRGAIGTNFTERRRLGAGCCCPSSISGHDVRHGARVPVANPLAMAAKGECVRKHFYTTTAARKMLTGTAVQVSRARCCD